MAAQPNPVQEAFTAVARREAGLHRTLSSGQLSMIAIGGAIGTGLFLGSSFAIGFAGPAVLVSYAIGALIALLLMGCLAEMTVAHPTTGSFGAWAEFYVSPLAGFLVRYSYWSAVVFALGTEVTAVAIYMRLWFPAVPGWVWIGGFSAVLVLVNAANVRLFGAVEYSFSALKIAAIVAFLMLGAWVVFAAPPGSGIGFRNLTAYGGFFPHGLSGAWTGVIVALFSFFSVEMIAVAAGEARDPRRAITRAFRATLLRLVIFYLLTLLLILAIVPWTQTATGASESPFVVVMARTHVTGAAAVVNLIILVAALSAMNSQLYVTSRMLFSLARAGSAPQTLGRVSRSGVPVPALLVSTLGIAVAAVLNVLLPGTGFALLMAISMFGAMFAWFMIFVTHLAFRRRNPVAGLTFRIWGYPYTSLLGAALMLSALITTFFTHEFHATLLYGIPFLLLLTAAFHLQRRTAPAPQPALAPASPTNS